MSNEDVLHETFNNLIELLAFNKKLKTCTAAKESMITQLAGFGGTSVGANTRAVLELLMTQEVAVNLSWLGRRKKMKFKELEYPDAIYRAERKKKRLQVDKDKVQVQASIKSRLKHAGGKLRKEQKQKQQPTRATVKKTSGTLL